jgi:hypothetical protein
VLQFSLKGVDGFPIKIIDLNRITAAFVPREAVVNVTTPQPNNGACTADGKFIWVAATATVAGHWSRLRVGQSCDPANIVPGSSGPKVRDHRAGAENYVPQGGVSVSPTKVMRVGLFTIPVVRSGASYIWGLDEYNKLTPEQGAQIKTQVMKKISGRGDSNWINLNEKWDRYAGFAAEPGSTSYRFTNEGKIRATDRWPAAAPGWGACVAGRGPGCWLTNFGWMRKIGFVKGDPGFDDRYFGFSDRYMPFARFKHPESGKDYGLWVRIQPVGPLIPATSTVWDTGATTPLDQTVSNQLQFKVAPIPDSGWWSDAWDWITDNIGEVVAEFYEAVWDVAEALSEGLCALTATPGALTVAANAGGPYGTAAGAATELLMDGKCPIPNPTPQGTPGPPTQNKLPFPWALVIGGVAVVAGVVLLGQKKPTS